MIRFTGRIVGFLAAAALVALAGGCETPPSGVPTAASLKGLKPSGSVTMTQVFLVSNGLGSGTLTFRGANHAFTMVGSLVGLGAVAGIEASGSVYNLTDLSQFSGAWLQVSPQLAISGPATGEIWLKNNHGVVMRLAGAQHGLSLAAGRVTVFIDLTP